MKVTEDKIVTVVYDLTVVDELDGSRELIERATKENPLRFSFGTGDMLNAFEKALLGLKINDRFSFALNPEEAYGVVDEEAIVDIPKSVFEEGGEVDQSILTVGNAVPMQDGNGNRITGIVLEILNDSVKMDFNHPLAGQTLCFDGEIISIEDIK